MRAKRIAWVNVNQRLILAVLLLVCLPGPSQAVAPGEFVVSQTLDSGPYSLRAGIEFANSHPGPDIIRFHPNLTGKTILLNSNLPPLTDNETTIDASPNWVGSWPTGEPGITLKELGSDGSYRNLVGLHIQGADNCAIKGLRLEGFHAGIQISDGATRNTIGAGSPGGRMLIRGCRSGIFIQNSDRNRVIGSYIGTSNAGNLPYPNDLHGIFVSGRLNEIGGTGPLEGNIIGASFIGIVMSGADTVSNTVQANMIGIGTLDGDIGAGIGIYILDASHNQVGGASADTGNRISGNSDSGVEIACLPPQNASFNRITWNNITRNNGHGLEISSTDPACVASNNSINGNYIADNDLDGINIAQKDRTIIQGNTIVGNGQNGVTIEGGSENYIYSNFIGTDTASTSSLGNHRNGVLLYNSARSNRVEGNVIAQNAWNGIGILSGDTTANLVRKNTIGVDQSGRPLGNGYYGVQVVISPGNIIQQNVIAHNGTSGSRAGVRIEAATATGNGIWANSIYSNTGAGIELFAGGNKNLAAPSIGQAQCLQVSGSGAPANGRVQIFSDTADEGRFYEGEVVADGSGQWDYTGAFHGPSLTATASDSDNNTSAFSAPVPGFSCGLIYLPLILRQE